MSDENSSNNTGDDWFVACSDEELTSEREDWSPSVVELDGLYEEIEKNGYVELEWKCPGRRPPSPVHHEESPSHSDVESNNEEKPNNYEFMDEMSSPQIRVRVGGTNELKGSAKKKTSSFDGILMNMRRHQQLSQSVEHQSSANAGLRNTPQNE